MQNVIYLSTIKFMDHLDELALNLTSAMLIQLAVESLVFNEVMLQSGISTKSQIHYVRICL